MATDQTSASKSVLLEVSNVLGAFRDKLVIVGGWVPELLYPQKGHIGSLDVDLAVSPKALSANAYQTIRKRMQEAGYSVHADPTRFTKSVAGASEPVKVDLISGQYVSGEKSDAIQLNELVISGLRGLDLAFEACEEMELVGAMPDGSLNSVRVRVVKPEAFILIKAFALDERKKEKDAYDIAFILKHYQPNLPSLSEKLGVHLANGLAQEGWSILQSKFASISSVGPVYAATIDAHQGTDFEQAKRAAFEDMQELIRLVKAL
jgi:hypothetical protein